MQDRVQRRCRRAAGMTRLAVTVLVVAVALTACDRDATDAGAGQGGFAAAPSSASPSPGEAFLPTSSAAPSPTPPADPGRRPRRGAPSDSCVEGWVTPPTGSPMFTDPLGIIRRTAPVDGEFVVVDMRHFTGPESPPSDKGYILEIDRWYIKLYVESDWSYQGRFIVEQRTFGRGVAAVAPYDSEGFRSPDWAGFQWNSADTEARAYPGLPGSWSGIPYDFVKGGAGLEIPGLPAEVRGCLQGT